MELLHPEPGSGPAQPLPGAFHTPPEVVGRGSARPGPGYQRRFNRGGATALPIVRTHASRNLDFQADLHILCRIKFPRSGANLLLSVPVDTAPLVPSPLGSTRCVGHPVFSCLLFVPSVCFLS